MITTERLKIYPADREQTEQLIICESDAELKQAYTEMLTEALAHPNEWQWYCPWFIETSNGIRVGDLCFKGVSNESVEIGYGVIDAHQGLGYATEAVTAAVEYALSQPEISCVEAETDPCNLASQRVLEKCGFTPNGHLGEEGPRFVFSK